MERLCWLCHCIQSFLLKALWAGARVGVTSSETSPALQKPPGPAERRAQSPWARWAHSKAALIASQDMKTTKVRAPSACRAGLGRNSLGEVLVGNSITRKTEQRQEFRTLQLTKLIPLEEHKWKQHTGTLVSLYKVSAFSVFEWQREARESSSLQWQFLWHPDKCPCCHLRILCLSSVPWGFVEG